MRRVPLHKRPMLVAVGSASMGFVCGALFWHALGFWSFVSHVVLRGPDETIQREMLELEATRSALRQQVPVHMRATGSISPMRPAGGGRGAGRAHETCSLAFPDAVLGETTVEPCPLGTVSAPIKPLARKGDLLATTVVANSPAASQPVSMPPLAWTPTTRGSAR